MTRPLSAEIGPIEEEWDTQSLLGVPFAFLSFCCTDESASILWLGVALTGRPSIIKKILSTATSTEIPNHKKRTKAYYSVFLCSEKPNETLSTQAEGQPAFLAVYLVTIFLPEHDMEV